MEYMREQSSSKLFEELMIYYLGHTPKKQTSSWYYGNGFSIQGALSRERNE